MFRPPRVSKIFSFSQCPSIPRKSTTTPLGVDTEGSSHIHSQAPGCRPKLEAASKKKDILILHITSLRAEMLAHRNLIIILSPHLGVDTMTGFLKWTQNIPGLLLSSSYWFLFINKVMCDSCYTPPFIFGLLVKSKATESKAKSKQQKGINKQPVCSVPGKSLA